MSRSTPDWLTDGMDHIWLPYAQMQTASLPLPVKATDGTRLILEDGRELIDGIASWWTACHGYNHPHIAQAVSEQVAKMPHVMLGGLANEPAYSLATRLAELAPGDLNRVFFAESGSVSVEAALKMAMQYWINQGHTTHKQFVCFEHGYHGDTLGTMAVCDPNDGMHTMFKGALLPQHVLKIPHDDETRSAFETFIADHHTTLAGVIVEPLVQGAGGFKFHDEEALCFIRQVTEQHNVLLILDEIMTGFGRLGTMFACEKAGIIPDIMTLSKALTGGTLPLSATISNDKVSAAFFSDDPAHAFMHGPTFSGNPLACAAAHASLDLFETEPRLDQIAAIESHLSQSLYQAKDIKGVVDVRVQGALGVIQMEQIQNLDGLKERFVERGLFLRPFNNVIYLSPSFTVTPEDLSTLITGMLEVTEEWSQRR